MGFNQEQKDALKVIFKEKAFLGYNNGKFQFKLGPKPSSITNFLKNLGAPECFEEVPCLMGLAYAIVKKNLPTEDLLEVIREWTVENKRELPEVEVVESEGSSAIAELGSFFRTLVPTVNISKNAKDKVILLDPSKNYRPVLDVDIESYYTLTGTTWRELLISDNVRKVMTCFDPYRLEYIFSKETRSGSMNIFHVNYYVPPRWRFVKADAKFTGFIKGLVEHLFPNKEDREYVLDWLHYAIVKRNETVLCLIGARGTGKGVLLYNIMGALIGQEYHSVAKQEVLTEKFNAEFNNKRFVYFDEVNVSGDKELNKFRQLANAKIAMEAKGYDAETIDNYASMALSSNDKRDFKAEPQERRFSVPEVTEQPLTNIYSEEEIEAFCKRIDDPDSVEIAEFGNFLINRVPTHVAQKPLKGKYFFELCRLSMPEWKTFIIDQIITEGKEGEPILNKTLDKLFKRVHGEKAVFPSRRATIQAFLGDYVHEAKYRIGTVVETEDANGRATFGIMPNELFLERYGRGRKRTEDEIATDDALEAL